MWYDKHNRKEAYIKEESLVGSKRRQAIRALEEEYNDVVSQIQILEEQLKVMNDARISLKHQITELKEAEEASRFVKTIKSVNMENTMVVELHEDTKTTPIIDAFLDTL